MRGQRAMTATVRLRISAREKGWLQAAADIQGVTLSDFIRATAHRSAEHILYQRKPLPSWNSGESISLLSPTPDELDAAVDALVSNPTRPTRNEPSGPLQEGDELVCVNAEPGMKLTAGKRYVVQWNRRPDINFPTVINDDGRPTMYNPRWFELANPAY